MYLKRKTTITLFRNFVIKVIFKCKLFFFFNFCRKLKNEKRITPDESFKFMTDILTGFIELIKNGIMHRDLKPANILINEDTYKIAGIILL